jgi:TonB family protein
MARSAREIPVDSQVAPAVEMVFVPSPRARRLAPQQPADSQVDEAPPATENISEQNTIARDRIVGGEDLLTPQSAGESPVPILVTGAGAGPGESGASEGVEVPPHRAERGADAAPQVQGQGAQESSPNELARNSPADAVPFPQGPKYLRAPQQVSEIGPGGERAAMTLAAAAANAAGEGDLSLSTYAWRWVPYMRTVKARIERNLHPPAAFSRLGIIEGTTRIYFRIYLDGRVDGPRLVQSSGQSSLDDASLHSVRASSPFPPLPDDFPEEHLEIVFTYYYRIPEWARSPRSGLTSRSRAGNANHRRERSND